MSDRYTDPNIHTNDVLRDVNTGEFVLLTNGICSLNHANPEGYREAHTDGCRFVPYEGYVFVGPVGNLRTWSMVDVRGRTLEKAVPSDAGKVREFFDSRCEDIGKGIESYFAIITANPTKLLLGGVRRVQSSRFQTRSDAEAYIEAMTYSQEPGVIRSATVHASKKRPEVNDDF